MLLDLLYFSVSPGIDGQMTRLLEKASGLRVRLEYALVDRRLRSFDPGQHPEYAEFRTRLYERVDPAFREYFDDNPSLLIRLDEILWGGVGQDGIPPLLIPRMTSAREADYLDDNNVVFGVFIDGDARLSYAQ